MMTDEQGRETARVRTTRLREDIRLLGDLLGTIITATEGPALFALEEEARGLAKRLRTTHDPADRDRLRAMISALSPDEAQRLVRSFATYFGLVNVAEQQNRVRRRRAYALQGREEDQPFSFGHTVHDLLERGVSADDVAAALDTMHIDLVLTAHPTEATRSSILTKHRAVAAGLQRLERETLTPAEHQEVVDDLYRQILLLWRTDSARTQVMGVVDEVKGVLFYVESTLLDALPATHRALEKALRAGSAETPTATPT